ncbi:uncharacterized protein BO95DRAFT_169564 [Aspergillus brunneoviolaceus CBS 621.78]|uniref:Uncharacterized protein n=1 Tax=Aspergillus brunneoviolaceus CBS 621.78 TaxID=1450534 RepID=A0ACD1G6E7_9EURO|nr:hypothetical protein BO95DRAFT_169564 [Aspergillus brunneoviolaceus CBS 621.78]RAH44737.1 hypothetical protein BO95DRAFT_169564 [Aspergillus brunneoviolaceus CBS 621.78]
MNVPLGLSQTFNVKGNNQTTQGIPMALGTSQTFNVSGINQLNQGMPVALRTDQMFNVQGINQPNEGMAMALQARLAADDNRNTSITGCLRRCKLCARTHPC